jgi:hypothetical protein
MDSSTNEICNEMIQLIIEICSSCELDNEHLNSAKSSGFLYQLSISLSLNKKYLPSS